jgi:hypothetical protein
MLRDIDIQHFHLVETLQPNKIFDIVEAIGRNMQDLDALRKCWHTSEIIPGQIHFLKQRHLVGNILDLILRQNTFDEWAILQIFDCLDFIL